MTYCSELLLFSICFNCLCRSGTYFGVGVRVDQAPKLLDSALNKVFALSAIRAAPQSLRYVGHMAYTTTKAVSMPLEVLMRCCYLKGLAVWKSTFSVLFVTPSANDADPMATAFFEHHTMP
jgi:hypothetical protein